MINHFLLLRNVGQFDNVNGRSNPLHQVTLVFGENGGGKTTLSAILRSLSTGDSVPIEERRRLGATNSPHVIIDASGGTQSAIYEQGAWSRTTPDLYVFDDTFVDANVYSGLVVDPAHRQGLHELVLGRQGVQLGRDLQTLVDRVETHNQELRQRAAAIPVEALHGLSVAEFCALPSNANLNQEILATERSLAVVQEREQIASAGPLSQLSLPGFDLQQLEDLAGRGFSTVDASAVERVQSHLTDLGEGGEDWVAEGMQLLRRTRVEGEPEECPFCAQSIAGSVVLAAYRMYFSEAYVDLTNDLAAAVADVGSSHGPEAVLAFERAVRSATDCSIFWSRYCAVPNIQIDLDQIVRDWTVARDAVQSELAAKQASPFESRTITEGTRTAVAAFGAHRQTTVALSTEFVETNTTIARLKQEQTAQDATGLAGRLNRLRATRSRYSAELVPLCDTYNEEVVRKQATEALRGQAREALDGYRAEIFPTCQTSVNTYLGRFNTGFRLGNVLPINTRAGSACNYDIVINGVAVPVAGGSAEIGRPCFSNTLSAGGRTTLAFAFFLASLDSDPDLRTKTVVIDDPISSLDEHRALATVQEVARLAARVEQLIVLSHSRPFLCGVWELANGAARSAIEVVRGRVGSVIRDWDVARECFTAHDERDALFRRYLAGDVYDRREVAEAIRPHLESMIRVACPAYFPPGSTVGQFLNTCRQAFNTPNPVLADAAIREIADITQYANLFHHDTNPAWQTQTINDAELMGYVGRTLGLVTFPT